LWTKNGDLFKKEAITNTFLTNKKFVSMEDENQQAISLEFVEWTKIY